VVMSALSMCWYWAADQSASRRLRLPEHEEAASWPLTSSNPVSMLLGSSARRRCWPTTGCLPTCWSRPTAKRSGGHRGDARPEAMEQAVDLVAAGGRIVILGLAARGVTVSFPALEFTRKEMTICGSRASVNCFPESLALLAQGVIHYPRFATQFDLWDAPAIFKQLAG